MNKPLGEEEEREEIDSSEQSLRTIEEEIAFVHTNVTFPEFKRYETVLRIPAEETETVSTMRAEYFEDYYLPKKEQLFFSDISKYVQTDEAFVELFLSTLAIETDESNEENEYVPMNLESAFEEVAEEEQSSTDELEQTGDGALNEVTEVLEDDEEIEDIEDNDVLHPLHRESLADEGIVFPETDLILDIILQITKLYQQDAIGREVLEKNKAIEIRNGETHEFYLSHNLILKKDDMFNRQILYVPINADATKMRIIDEYHRGVLSGHRNAEKTLLAIQENFYWRFMKKDVYERVGRCATCQISRSRRPRVSKIKPFAYYAPRAPFDYIHIDQKTGYNPGPNGESAVWVVIDALSRRCYLLPCKFEYGRDDDQTSAEELARLLYTRVFMEQGFPKKIITDKGSQFTGQIWKALQKHTGIYHNVSSADHAQTNGLAERMIDTMSTLLRSSIIGRLLDRKEPDAKDFSDNTLDRLKKSSESWVSDLPIVQFAYNNSRHPALGKYTPFEASMGRKVAIPLQVSMRAFMLDPEHELLQNTDSGSGYDRFEEYLTNNAKIIGEVQRKLGQWYDDQWAKRKLKSRAEHFEPGELVLFDRRKGKSDFKLPALEPRVAGPFRIIKRTTADTYIVDFGDHEDFRNKKQPINGKHLFRFNSELDIDGSTLAKLTERKIYAKRKFEPSILDWKIVREKNIQPTSKKFLLEVSLLIKNKADQEPIWKPAKSLIHQSFFRSKIFAFAHSNARRHHDFLLKIIHLKGTDRVILSGNTHRIQSYSKLGDLVDTAVLEKQNQDRLSLGEEAGAPFTGQILHEKLKKSRELKKPIILEINGNSGDIKDDDPLADDGDIVKWHGILEEVKKDEVRVKWLSRVDTSHSFILDDSGQDWIPIGSIEKIVSNGVIVDKIDSKVEFNSLTTFTKASPLLLALINIKQIAKKWSSDKPMKILELCCGTKSGESAVKDLMDTTFTGHKIIVTTVDIDKTFEPDYVRDITDWHFWKNDKDPRTGLKAFEPGTYDLVIFTPPCTEYSMAKTIGFRNLSQADRIVSSGLAFIQEHLKPRYWIMENPASGSFALHTRPFMKQYEKIRHLTSYCMYGFPYRKLTSLWSNIPRLNLKCCLTDPCAYFKEHGRHESVAQRGTSRLANSDILRGHSVNDLYRIPPSLIAHILEKMLLGIIENEKEDWSLSDKNFLWLKKKFQFDIEAFATARNRRLVKYWSLMKEKGSSGIDAFSQNWNNQSIYMNPPFSRLHEVVQKIKNSDGSEFTVIAPKWNKSWWNELCVLAIESGGEFGLIPNEDGIFKKQLQVKNVSQVHPPPDWETYYFHIKSKKTVAEEIVYDINLVDVLDDIDQVTLDICSDSE